MIVILPRVSKTSRNKEKIVFLFYFFQFKNWAPVLSFDALYKKKRCQEDEKY